MKSSLCFLFIALVLVQPCLTQEGKSIDPEEVKSMPVVHLDLWEKSYPKSYLSEVNEYSISVISSVVHQKTRVPNYFQGDIDFSEINKIKLVERNRQWRTNLIGAGVGMVSGFLVGRALRPEPERQFLLDLINQPTSKSIAEPILGSVIGGCAGLVVAEYCFTPVRIKNVSSNPEQASSILSGFIEKSRRKKK